MSRQRRNIVRPGGGRGPCSQDCQPKVRAPNTTDGARDSALTLTLSRGERGPFFSLSPRERAGVRGVVLGALREPDMAKKANPPTQGGHDEVRSGGPTSQPGLSVTGEPQELK